MARTDRHLVVDGSNIATEGRTVPSLAQLGEAMRAIGDEFPRASVTVIVDATFAHRIEAAEREAFEAALQAGEIIAPPAGVVGRGDAFILQVAEKAGAVVCSNDSFQEFHGDHGWLFDKGRLIGGKPIDGVGWVFVERCPVRGATSRRAARKSASGSKTTSPRKEPKPAKPAKAPAASPAATATANGSDELNDTRSFMRFVNRYSIGDEVTGTIERFSSHGCYLRAGSARCYLPSRAMGDPPPSRARDVVVRGQDVIVKVESLDADRRGINVALVRAVGPHGVRRHREGNSKPGRPNTARKPQQPPVTADGPAGEGQPTRSERTVATKKTAKKTARKPSAKARTTKKAATATTSVRAQKAAAKKTAAASKSTATKTATKKASGTKKATKASTRKATKKATSKATTKKPAANKAGTKKSGTEKASAKKSTGTKSTGTKAGAKKSTTKKSSATKAAKKSGSTTKKAASKATTKKPAPSSD